jgi:hypothetical protein
VVRGNVEPFAAVIGLSRRDLLIPE